jgi:hypothetical protein
VCVCVYVCTHAQIHTNIHKCVWNILNYDESVMKDNEHYKNACAHTICYDTRHIQFVTLYHADTTY